MTLILLERRQRDDALEVTSAAEKRLNELKASLAIGALSFFPLLSYFLTRRLATFAKESH